MGVYRFMRRQKNQPWLKRYLKRDEILREISSCDSMLRDALTLFGVRLFQITLLPVLIWCPGINSNTYPKTSTGNRTETRIRVNGGTESYSGE